MTETEIREFKRRADALLLGPNEPIDSLGALMDETGVKVLTRLVKEARELLTKLEWIDGPGGLACEICGRFTAYGHLPDCRLKRFLDETKRDGDRQ
ncbi:MAG: hypothetical protein ACM3ZC_13600 [Bacteroidota bacterium]